MADACALHCDQRGLSLWLKDYRTRDGGCIEWIWTAAKSLAMRLPRDVAGAVQRQIVASEDIAVAVIAVEARRRPADCVCTSGAVCRQNSACPRLARADVER